MQPAAWSARPTSSRWSGALRAPRSALFLLGLLLAATSVVRPNPPVPVVGAPLSAIERAARLPKVKAGQSRAQVHDWLGPERQRGRQLVYQRWREQWVYGDPPDVRLDFEATGRGEPRLIDIQTPRGAGR